MNKEEYLRIIEEIDNFDDKLGETVHDEALNDPMWNTSTFGYGIQRALSKCETKKEFELIDDILIAFCGWSFQTLVEMIRERDKDEYPWESV